MMFENISVRTALKLIYEGKGFLFDIRDEKDFKKGHLPMAVHGNKEMIRKKIEELGERNSYEKKMPYIIIYCDYGNQSMRMAKELAEEGYSNLASVVGGYHAYEGYVETERQNFWTMEWKKKEP